VKCLETRTTVDGFKRRRYEDAGVRFSTIEVPLAVWNTINKQGRARDRATQAWRAAARAQLRLRVLDYKAQGWSARKAAYVSSVPLRTVQRWFKEAP
jgi:hypothetical protein